MRTKKLHTILDQIANSPRIKKALADSRQRANDKAENSSTLRKFAFGAVELGALTFGGRKVKRLAILLPILIELTFIFKEQVIDDPAVQKMLHDAWAELENQSTQVYKVAKTQLSKVINRTY
jgi:phage gp36-like protein